MYGNRVPHGYVLLEDLNFQDPLDEGLEVAGIGEIYQYEDVIRIEHIKSNELKTNQLYYGFKK